LSERIIPAIMLAALILVGVVILALNIQSVKASGTIYIRADGSVDPDGAPISSIDNITYTLTDNINEPIVVERDNVVVDGVGFKVQGTGNETGILLSGRTNVTIRNMEVRGFDYGILFSGVSNSSIYANTITANGVYNVFIRYGSEHNNISENNIKNCHFGIGLDFSSDCNYIYRNNITGISKYAIFLDSGDNNTVYENNIANNLQPFLIYSENNTLYHNNFVGNIAQGLVHESSTILDNGYPSGGNYWSHYIGTDSFRGPYQNETGSDGIGDTEYVIGNSEDQYPLMKPYPWSQHDIGVTDTTVSKTVVGKNLTMQISVMVFNYGIYAETFNMTLYANMTIIATFMNINLLNRSCVAIPCNWNTTNFAKGNYTITTYITPVPGELDTVDNSLTDGWIIVAMIGDITGQDDYPDNECDMRDVGLVARYFGQTVPSAPANCDLTGPTSGVPDDEVDMRDVGMVARHFGETDP